MTSNEHQQRTGRGRRLNEFSSVALSVAALASGVVDTGSQSAEAASLSKNISTVLKAKNQQTPTEVIKERKLGSGVHFNCLSVSSDDRTKVFEDLRAAHIGWVRINLNWNDIEPVQGSYDNSVLTNLDDCIAKASSNAVKPLIVFQGSPEWANGGKEWNNPPINPTYYAQAVGFLATRYNGQDKTKGEVKAWEIWNEPNFKSFWQGTPKQLAELINQSYASVKKANPKAYVVLPGIAQNNAKYLDILLSKGVNFDILATHFYPDISANNADESTQEIGQELETIIQVMKKHGVKAPVWVTEFGIPRTNGIDANEQAQLTKKVINVIRKYPAIKNAFWWQAMPSGGSDPWERSLGSIDSNGQPWPVLSEIGKLSINSYRTTTRH